MAFFDIQDNDAPKSKCIVRIKTSVWSDNNGLYIKKNITYLRRKSNGFNILDEEIGSVGADDALKTIVNINECADGVYEVIMVNVSHDYESGYVDGYDLELVEVSE